MVRSVIDRELQGADVNLELWTSVRALKQLRFEVRRDCAPSRALLTFRPFGREINIDFIRLSTNPALLQVLYYYSTQSLAGAAERAVELVAVSTSRHVARYGALQREEAARGDSPKSPPSRIY